MTLEKTFEKTLESRIETLAGRMSVLPGHSVLLFTGAGISVESGIPPFRGENGLWTKYDPEFISLDYFYAHPEDSWRKIKEVFYDKWGAAFPNPAHLALADMQKEGLAGTLVTQNIDCLHQRAGSRDVVEFHGTLDRLVCTECTFSSAPSGEILECCPPRCPLCGKLLKPDFVFFGEAIPPEASSRAFRAAESASLVLVIGTSGTVMPACMIPREAKRHGAYIVEVNPHPSAYTEEGVTDLFLAAGASRVLPRLLELLRERRGGKNGAEEDPEKEKPGS